MALWTYEDVIPSLIENATTKKGIADGVPTTYEIKPVDGYVLHDKARDWEDFDDNDNVIEYQGFTRGTATCSINYDFNANPREFFTRLESEVPADQIFGGGNNHEVI